MSKTFVFIGRFQPLHLGHEKIIDEALKQCDKLIVMVGSANRARSVQNPFTFHERYDMINERWRYSESQGKLQVVPLDDYLYNDEAWTIAVQQRVNGYTRASEEISLVGFSKDASSYYLKLFPQWGSVNIPSQHSTFNSTDIRNRFLQAYPVLPHDICSPGIVAWLNQFMYTEHFKSLVAEAKHVYDYKFAWQNCPFPPVFSTVDAVVIQSGHILLVRRGEQPGKGLLAFPGGFLDVNETLLESAIRELREETRISDNRGEIPPGVLRSFITRTETFDDPRRFSRGRTLTQAYLFELPKKNKLYKVVGSDDAAEAIWYPIGSIKPTEFFEDHYFIMCKMLGLTI